jgi:hypothetical protein
LLIKQKSAAQGNIEETSGRFADATNWDIAFRNRPSALVPKFVMQELQIGGIGVGERR